MRTKTLLVSFAAAAIGSAALWAGFDGFKRSGEARVLPGDTRRARATAITSPAPAERPIPAKADAEAETVALLTGAPTSEWQSSYLYLAPDGFSSHWSYEKMYGVRYFKFTFNYNYYGSDRKQDAWVILPLDAEIPDGASKLSFDMKTFLDETGSSGHDFSVWLGTQPSVEGMTEKILEVENHTPSGTTMETASTVSATVDNELTGVCYLGIHVTSPVNAMWINFFNINLTAEISSNPVIPAGEIFSMHPTEEEFGECTVIDGNEDGNKIKYNVVTGGNGETYDWPIYYNKSENPAATLDADEWIITKAINLPDASRLYTASIEACTTTTSPMQESFEIVLGKSADLEGMRAGKAILGEPYLSNADYKTFSSNFGIAEAGDYYVGIHITSPVSDSWRIALRNLKIELTDNSAQVPGSCSNLVLTPDSEGALKATVSFQFPTSYLNETAAEATDEMTAEISTPAATVTATGKPGETVEKTVETVEGLNSVAVTVSNANGTGNIMRGTVRCGLDVPTDPCVSSKVSDDNMSMTLTWEPVTIGENGGIVSANGLTYNIYEYVNDGTVSRWIPVETGISECKYTFTHTGDTQQVHQLQVSAENSKGESEGDVVSFAAAVLGKPYVLPLSETFPGGTQTYSGLLIDYPSEEYTAQWALDNPQLVGIEGGPAYALMCVTTQNESTGKGYVELPKLSTTGAEKVRLSLNAFVWGGTPKTIVKLYGTDGRSSAVEIGKFDSTSGEGWCTLSFDIPEAYQNKQWVVIALDVEITNPEQILVVSGYSVYERKAKDIAALRTDLPSYVRVGEDVDFTVTVGNLGYEDAQAPQLNAILSDGDTHIAEIALTGPEGTIGSEKNSEYKGHFRFDSADMSGKTLRMTVEAALEGDEDETNNILNRDFRAGYTGDPVAEELEATLAENKMDVNLKWDNPYAEGYTDNIESYVHGSYDSRLGAWKNIDFDGLNPYTTQAFDIPDAQKPKAFQTINNYLCGMEAMPAISGNQFLMAFSPNGGKADDWLISPEIKGGTKLSFALTSLSGEYEEAVEILVSSTDDDFDSFSCFKKIETDDAGWYGYEMTLPADAKYFAIHYASDDKFGIALDDIVYSPAVPEVEITGWNIYRDGELISDNHPDAYMTDTTTEEDTEHKYNVAAVGKRSGVDTVFPLSATVTAPRTTSVGSVESDRVYVVSSEGRISVSGCGGEHVGIVNVNGVKVYSSQSAPATLNLDVEIGVYVVTVGNKSVKVIVR